MDANHEKRKTRCTVCSGTGKVRYKDPEGFDVEDPCPVCDGQGAIDQDAEEREIERQIDRAIEESDPLPASPRNYLEHRQFFESEMRHNKLGLDVRLWRVKNKYGSTEACTNVPWKIIYHSPDGFEWGYYGSGPADLALNILYCFVDFNRAWKLHQRFKDHFLATRPEGGGTIRADEIRAWIEINDQ